MLMSILKIAMNLLRKILPHDLECLLEVSSHLQYFCTFCHWG